MANKIYNYDTPSEFTYNDTKIEVSGGLATLKEDLTNIYARYHLQSINTGDSVEDTSGNSRDGIAINSPSVVAGKLNNCFSFNGTNQYVNLGNIASFERTDSFSVECWFKTSVQNKQLVTKNDNDAPFSGWALYILNDRLACQLTNDNSPVNRIVVAGDTTGLDNNAWHHAVFTYNGNSLASGVHLYVDNHNESLTVYQDSLTASIINVVNCQIGAKDGANAVFDGLIDEVVIYDKELTSTEVAYRYNSSSGRENWLYYSDKPTIEPTDLFEPATVISWNTFLETLGGGNEGSIGYNLYKVNKTNKYYWNGNAWVTGGSSSNYNTVATINTNIETFDESPDKIGFIAYLISDGEQKVELDENQITYSTNQIPIVNAGSNKACKDHETIALFSDCSFSDPDTGGTVDYAYYKVDGEVDTWTEISQGGYGTLLEAVQAFTYQFDNLGTLTCRLQVEDNEGAKSDDSLEVEVSKYTKTVNIKDSETLEHLSGVSFDPDDGTGIQTVNSPFDYSWEYGTFDIVMTKALYYDKSQSISISDETDLGLTLVEKSIYNECKAVVGLLWQADSLVIDAWLAQGGEIYPTPTSCEIILRNSADVDVYHPPVNTTPNVEGLFCFSRTPSLLVDEQIYHLLITIIANGTTYNSVIAVGKMERDKSALNGKVYIDVINGESGTGFPIGTVTRPVNNLADAITIADDNKLKEIIVSGELTLTQNISGYKIIARTCKDCDKIILNNQNVTYSHFNGIELTGICNGHIDAQSCRLNNISNLEGVFMDCAFTGNFSIKSGGSAYCFGSFSDDLIPMEFDMNGDGILIFYGTAWITIKNLTNANGLVGISGDIGVTIDSTVTDGNIYITGDTIINADNKTGGNIVTDYKNSYKVWEELLTNHTLAGSTGKTLNKILGLSQENYRIVNPIYDSKHNLTSATIKIYPTKTDCDNNTNAIATYSMTASYNTDNEMTSYRVTKE